ncbi:DNA binding protein, nucleoid-associated [Anaerobiospirillum thomasii]|uniref:DNA-binding protein n=1 Tax=Anaerobiospirillum thomasii TaxID=179995 RepID=A0A2X0V3B0_9GAMM|nr:H-NS family nucleoid-associated regulatory protein [Anaerobiospirillum thomasii]SPT68413.1 DNA binding protein, nucleoid-associated [Anaerobiospirillum thomasii]SPT70919.1 DNA binding protein, nucleoid-associated [Anaerobiospirillum thomasii]
MPMSLRALKNARNLQAALRGATIEDIDSIIAKLQEIRSVIEEAELEESIKEAERKEKLEQALEYLQVNNISVDDLVASKSLNKHQKLKFKPKYKYTDLDGVERTWTGQGKLPTHLRNLLEQTGKSKEDFRIDD